MPLVVKSRENGPVNNKSIYLALGINLEGEKELLGLWISESEGASFWQQVFTELQNRGVEDCYVACVDGLNSPSVRIVVPPVRWDFNNERGW